MEGLEPGVKVKCIDDQFVDQRTNPFRKSDLNLPIDGEIYTIREVVDAVDGQGLRLMEVRNKTYYWDNICREEEPIFCKDRFEVFYKKP